ncbi:hypothetical protein F5Y03DRAFT_361961 [Xylaria venustula]|nr:hypothetical protein F5Y03DRAFT_361961 [Xylaria venustula]
MRPTPVCRACTVRLVCIVRRVTCYDVGICNEVTKSHVATFKTVQYLPAAPRFQSCLTIYSMPKEPSGRLHPAARQVVV